MVKFMEMGGCFVILFDGDIVWKNFSFELGFFKEYCDFNIKCIGYVVFEIIKNGGIVICVFIVFYVLICCYVCEEIE